MRCHTLIVTLRSWERDFSRKNLPSMGCRKWSRQTRRRRIKYSFGITVRAASGVGKSYRIVGVDDVEFDRRWVSLLSPVVRALNNARPREWSVFNLPLANERH